MRLRIPSLSFVASALSLGALLALGHPIGSPPIGSWDALGRWYDASGAARAVVAGLRLAAIGACGWLLLAAALQLLAGVVRLASLARLADEVSPRFLRSVATGAASLSMTAGLTVPASAVPTAGDPPSTAVMVPLDAPTRTSTTSTTTSTSTTRPEPLDVLPPPASPPAPRPAPRASLDREVVVEPGDSFWSIAVEEAEGGDVGDYWRALIEANRDRLTDPDNPDLLYAGQVLTLP